MSVTLDFVTPADLGERLRIAREAAKVTQSAAAAAANLARTTLVAIEQGQRRVRVDEVQALARLYKTSVNALLRREAVHIDLLPRHRKLASRDDPAAEDAAHLLSGLVKAEVELENLLGIQRLRNYPQQRPILPGDVRLQAEQDAMEVREWLGLGLGPVPDMVALLELQLGVRTFVRPLLTRISGLYAFDEAVGACVLLNSNVHRSRQRYVAAHELAHLVSSRGEPEVLLEGGPQQARGERYAGAFALGFLMPARAVMQQFKQTTAAASHLARRYVILLAQSFGVSREAMVRRLEELKLVRAGSWDWFQSHGGITDEQARQVLGESTARDADGGGPVPMASRLNLLAAQAWQKDLLSEGQLARLLNVDRVALREMLDALTDDPAESDEALELRG